jgi:hypothetical protein
MKELFITWNKDDYGVLLPDLDFIISVDENLDFFNNEYGEKDDHIKDVTDNYLCVDISVFSSNKTHCSKIVVPKNENKLHIVIVTQGLGQACASDVTIYVSHEKDVIMEQAIYDMPYIDYLDEEVDEIKVLLELKQTGGTQPSDDYMVSHFEIDI